MIKNIIYNIYKWFMITSVTIIGAFTVAIGLVLIEGKYYSEEAYDQHYRDIYKRVLTQTGQTQDAPVFVIAEGDQLNAYTNGQQVVLYRGILNYTKSDDEIAYIMGHELAHVMLRHTSDSNFHSDYEGLLAEANADKMGAFYMMKAGYDICKAREIWKRMKNDNGNMLGISHPDYSYRYDELNVNCG